LHKTTPERNSEPPNIESQNVEGLICLAQPFYKHNKSDRIHSFDIRYSLFVIRYSLLDKFRLPKFLLIKQATTSYTASDPARVKLHMKNAVNDSINLHTP